MMGKWHHTPGVAACSQLLPTPWKGSDPQGFWRWLALRSHTAFAIPPFPLFVKSS